MLLSKYEQDTMNALLKYSERKKQNQEIIECEIRETKQGLEQSVFSFNIPDFFQGLKSYEQFETNFRAGSQKNRFIERIESIESSLKQKYGQGVDVFEYLAYLRVSTQSKAEMRAIILDELGVDIAQPTFQIFFTKCLGYSIHESKGESQNDTQEIKQIDRDKSIQKNIDAILQKNFVID